MTEQLKICGKLLRQERADSECRYIYINPNGPEAVEAIEALVEALETHPGYHADTTFAAIWQWLEKKDAALSLARGEPPVSSLGGPQ